MDEMIQAPQTPENTQQIDQPQIDESPKEHGKIRKIFNASSWFVFFAFLPVTVLIFLSQNTVPGDMFYPIKRSMENVVLAAATVSPTTRAAFRTDLTTRRFDEAEKLLLGSSDINGLKEFVVEIQAAQEEVSAISDPIKKQELQQKIQTSVIEYEKRLDAVKVKLVAREPRQLAIIATLTPTGSQTVSPTIEPTTIPLPTNTPFPVPTAKVGQPAIPTNTPVPLPTSTPKPPTPSKQTPSATPTPVPPTDVPTIAPTLTSEQTPTSTPVPSFTPTPTPVPEQTDGERTMETVDKVQEYLRCLKNTQPPHRECIPPEINSASYNSASDQLEGRSEEKPKRDAKLKEKKEKENDVPSVLAPTSQTTSPVSENEEETNIDN